MSRSRDNRGILRPAERLRPAALWALVALLPLAAGCGDGFTDVEMHLGSEAKVRPYALLCEPPEVAPGDSVTLTLLCWSPNPAALHVDWQVALDYDLGQYEADEVERRIVDLDATIPIPPHSADEEGFVRQSFRYVVPDSALLWSSALPEPMRDEAMIELARMALPEGADPSSRRTVEAYLRALRPDQLPEMDPLTRGASLALADRFAARIRFRATLHEGITVDVTRNLTVRHSGRLGSPNANRNPEVASLEVIAFPSPDVEDPDDPEHQGAIVRYPLDLTAGGTPGNTPELQIPQHDDWTYYLVLTPNLQEYTSPFSGDRLFAESDSYRWYYFRLDDPASDYALFRDDPGDETEMWSLDESVHLIPPPSSEGSRYRIVACLRDERPEWAMYQTTPGCAVAEGVIVFRPAP